MTSLYEKTLEQARQEGIALERARVVADLRSLREFMIAMSDGVESDIASEVADIADRYEQGIHDKTTNDATNARGNK